MPTPARQPAPAHRQPLPFATPPAPPSATLAELGNRAFDARNPRGAVPFRPSLLPHEAAVKYHALRNAAEACRILAVNLDEQMNVQRRIISQAKMRQQDLERRGTPIEIRN